MTILLNIKQPQRLAVLAIIPLLFFVTIATASAKSLTEGYSQDTKTVIKQTAIGAGMGALLGGMSERGTMGKGAAAGALSGLGSGVVDTNDKLRNKPLLRNSIKGAVIGTGVGAATNRGLGKSAAVGAASGAGYQLIRDYMNK